VPKADKPGAGKDKKAQQPHEWQAKTASAKALPKAGFQD
jgi:hypothetical protein